ncbi:uncharacterized protein LOC111799063 isoform X2 [Cucurbita pepo subsp. pepo]|uniref:uncharacterized protein LOC111799063 isoform X2 n=1 Tax=Cucurbita pepo subsp. pepo TaxID=3664 RepID=UPI000C9D448E|nr:uncharacterized protein LOC111799063 isoform X2 [Cucurbita pepo subsp. pepo]
MMLPAESLSRWSAHVRSRVAEMEELDHFQQLRILELGSTRPQYCVASEGHYLSQNGVSELEGISTLGDNLVTSLD